MLCQVTFQVLDFIAHPANGGTGKECTQTVSIMENGKACPQCAVARVTSRRIYPPLKPISVSQIFHIVGVDIMELAKAHSGNKQVVVFRIFFLSAMA